VDAAPPAGDWIDVPLSANTWWEADAARSCREAGTLKAPFSGVHGWYFKNDSGQDIEIVLKAAGFFTE